MSRAATSSLIAAAALLGACATAVEERPPSAAAPTQANAVATTTSAPTPPGADDTRATDDEFLAQVVALNAALTQRFRAGDLLGVAAMYADDAVMLGPDGYRVAGRAAIDAYWTRFKSPVDWQLEIVAVDGRRGLIHQRGVSHLSDRRDSGELHTSTVDFVVLWVLGPDDAYRIGVDAYW